MRLSVFLLSVSLVRAWWVGQKELTFEEARSYCSPGDLATFSTNQELSDLLWTNKELTQALANQSTVHLWVGLEKPKDLCVVQDLPFRGFRWIDGQQDSELHVWSKEPKDTCTNVRCGALAVDSQSHGLVSMTCKTKNWFICGPGSAKRPETSPGPAETKEPDPEPDLNPRFNEDLGPGSVSTPASKSDAPSSGFRPGPGPGHRSCSTPAVPRSRSLSLDPDKPDLVLVECWSGEKLMLHCSNGDWVLSKGPQLSPRDPGLDPDLTRDQNQTLEVVWCSGCGQGLRLRDGQCEDIDECSLSPAPCAHGCVNAHGSFMCTPAPLSAALVPALVAVAVVTLAVVIAVTVWCCIRKKRRHREEKKQDQNQTEA